MEKLLEYYKRRLVNITILIEKLEVKNETSPYFIRLRTKASCYRTIIADLEHCINKNVE